MKQEQCIPLFALQDLSVDFVVGGMHYTALDQVSIQVHTGEIVGLIGESGCGKSLTALYAMGLQPSDAQKMTGSVLLMGKNTDLFAPEDWNAYRGKEVSMIFQDPMAVLNPLIRVGTQIAETAILHGVDKQTATQMAKQKMQQVGLADVEKVYQRYPHELSGGMCQRIVIAMALMNNPPLLIADEPTTALDVTIQAQIIRLIQTINQTSQTAVLFISHDLALVKEVCHRVSIMYAGILIEEGDTQTLLNHPLHPYTVGLLQSIPSYQKRGEDLSTILGTVPALEVRSNTGCPFAQRCPHCMPLCKEKLPTFITEGERRVRCHLYSSSTKEELL